MFQPERETKKAFSPSVTRLRWHPLKGPTWTPMEPLSLEMIRFDSCRAPVTSLGWNLHLRNELRVNISKREAEEEFGGVLSCGRQPSGEVEA